MHIKNKQNNAQTTGERRKALTKPKYIPVIAFAVQRDKQGSMALFLSVFLLIKTLEIIRTKLRYKKQSTS